MKNLIRWPLPKQGWLAARLLVAALLSVHFTNVPAAAQAPAAQLDAAREAARANRNAEAARLFGAHLAANPSDRRGILREFADQLLYSDRPERALSLLDEILSWDLPPEERRRAAQSRALALLWSDQQRQARASYNRLLADDPTNRDAAFNRIRASQWMGRPDRAQLELNGLPPELRTTDRALEIRRDLRLAARPLTSATVQQISQADGLNLSTGRIEQAFYRRSGAARLGAFFEYRDFNADDSSIRVNVPGVFASVRASDALQFSGSLAAERQRGSAVRRTQLVHEAGVAFLPSDRFRFDLVAARRTLDNIRSLKLGLSTRHYFASADYWHNPRLKLSLRGELTDFSDGNARRWVQAEVERRLSRKPNIFIGARATAFHFEQQLNNGYFNPKSFRSAELTARGWGQIGKATWIELGAAAGPEHDEPGGTKLAYSLRGKLSRALSDNLELSLRAERLSSHGTTDTGFSRNIVSASLGLRW